MRFGSRVVQAGLPPVDAPGAFLPGPVFAGTFVASGEPAASPYTYGRYHNPTWTAYETALAELEGGPALVFASGMAAVVAVLATALQPGETLVLPEDSYMTTRAIADGMLARMGITVRRGPTAGSGQRGLLDGARLLWLESPSNPELSVCDIALLAREAHARGMLVAVDNTTASPALQQPLALGADFSVSSDSKVMTGHGDLILGHVAVRDPEWHERIRVWRTQQGSIPGPMEVWLAHRSLATLDVRLERQCASARRVAEWLAARADVAGTRWPGLAGDPGHEVATRQMRDFGCVIGFDLGARARAERFLGALRMVRESTSFGGLRTTAERRARWGGDAIGEGFIRLSVGCEDVEDLLEDFAQALATAGA